MNPYVITETYDLLRLVEKIQPAASYLTDMFFSAKETTLQDVFSVEVVKRNRRLAPMLVEGSRALNMSREGSTVKLYKPPLIGARRTIGLEDISRRMIGEMPIVSTLTPEDRANRMQAQDMTDLLDMLTNRREQMASSLLTTGQIEVRGFAEDGKVVEAQTIVFDADWVTSVTTPWSSTSATIYDDIKAAVDYIAEQTGELPDVMICGAKVEGYLLKNKEILDWLMIPNRANMALASIAPRYLTAQSRFIGVISALGLDVYSYQATYVDDVTGQVKSFIPQDTVIIGKAGAGKYLFGRVDLVRQGNWTSYSGENIPVYSSSDENQTTSLTLYSRSLPILPVVDSVRCLKVVAS